MKKVILAAFVLSALSAFADTTATTTTTTTATRATSANCKDENHYPIVSKTELQTLLQDKNATIVAYCGGPMCEAWQKAATKACAMGYTNIKHFKDGIIGWVKN